MTRWVALFRGVNVGGKNRMPMARLVAILKSLEFEGVQTYIQSGNAIFSTRIRNKVTLAKQILDKVESEFGFRPGLVLLTASEFQLAISVCPFLKAMAEPKTLHFCFLESIPAKPDLDGLKRIAVASERFQLAGAIFFLHAPDGFGRSKLAAAIERKLGVSTTARNFQTIAALANMLDGV